MKWWFSSWNLFLFSLSKVCRISSADCFISGFTASQSTLFCEAKYSVLHFAQWLSVLLRFCFQSFSLRYALKNTLEKTIFNLYPTSFSASFILFYSPFLLLRVHERQIISLLILESFNLFAGVLCKSFLSSHYNWKVPRRLSGYFTKILQKNCREFFPTTAYKKEVRYNSNFLFYFYYIIS